VGYVLRSILLSSIHVLGCDGLELLTVVALLSSLCSLYDVTLVGVISLVMFRDETEMRNVTHYGAFALHTIHIHYTRNTRKHINGSETDSNNSTIS